jgi:hypothetical protein
MVIYWLNFEVKRKLWPRKKIFVDSRQELTLSTNKFEPYFVRSKYSASWSFGT